MWDGGSFVERGYPFSHICGLLQRLGLMPEMSSWYTCLVHLSCAFGRLFCVDFSALSSSYRSYYIIEAWFFLPPPSVNGTHNSSIGICSSTKAPPRRSKVQYRIHQHIVLEIPQSRLIYLSINRTKTSRALESPMPAGFGAYGVVFLGSSFSPQRCCPDKSRQGVLQADPS